MTKRSVKSIILVLMMLTIALYFISGTYARYTDTFTGTGTVQVAKWNVKVNEKAASESATFDLTFTEEENDYVVDGKLAPDVTLKSQPIVIDLTDTEVAVDIKAETDAGQLETALQEALGDSKDDVEVSVDVYKGETAGEEPLEDGIINLTSQSAGFTGTDAKYCVVVKLTWTETETHNVSDTAAGVKASTVSVPVNLTVQQHLAKDDV